MNWNVLLLLVLFISLITETRRFVKRHSLRDLAVFLTVWGLAVLSVAVNMMELPGLRPLEWIGAIMEPINKLMP